MTIPKWFLNKIHTKSKHRCFFHGALLLRKNAVLSTAFNHDQTHAEAGALNAVWPSERRGTILLSIRLTKGGQLSMAKPCDACMKFIKESGVKKVIYSTRDRKMEVLKI